MFSILGEVLCRCCPAAVGTLPQWHPACLREQFLIDPNRASRLLEHASSFPCLDDATPLPLCDALISTSTLASSADGNGGASLPASKAEVEDLFAPSSPLVDLFAPLSHSAAARMDTGDGQRQHAAQLVERL